MLKQILQMSQTMLALAEQDEWEQVEALQRDRQQLVEQVFPLADDAPESVQAATAIEQILKLDGQLRPLAESRHREIGKALGRLNQGRQATRAYQDTSRR